VIVAVGIAALGEGVGKCLRPAVHAFLGDATAAVVGGADDDKQGQQGYSGAMHLQFRLLKKYPE
jgi:hypothetical protein